MTHQALDEIGREVHDIDGRDDQPFVPAPMQYADHPGQRPHPPEHRVVGHHSAENGIGTGVPVGTDECRCCVRPQNTRRMGHQRLPVKPQQPFVDRCTIRPGTHAAGLAAGQHQAGKLTTGVIHPPM